MDEVKTEKSNSKIQKLGLILAGLFYLTSCVAVFFNTSGDALIRNEKVQTITFAHWQLEDGFREGYAEAIKQFEELKRRQGVHVKVIQTTVPGRGYRQWFLTQLISGNPADLIELNCTSTVKNQYFVPLSEYVARPNPFNAGTELENVPWQDCFVDSMEGCVDEVYSEIFGISSYFHVLRLFVNLELLEAATGSRKMPETVDEWLESCEKLRRYGRKQGKTIIPIGVRGFDKGTLKQLFDYYFRQLATPLCDLDITRYDAGPGLSQADTFRGIIDGKIELDRLLGAIDIMRKIGQYFGEGFPATDLEQTKFLFFTGFMGYFPEGTWNAFSMVNNSPFEVGITTIPIIGPESEYSRYSPEVCGERIRAISGQFGIPRASKNFDLALEFLQFTSSRKISKMIMIDHCKWPSPVKGVEYSGIMKNFEPRKGKSGSVNAPFTISGGRSISEFWNNLQDAILNNDIDSKRNIWGKIVQRQEAMRGELQENRLGFIRGFFTLENLRSSFQVIMMTGSDRGKHVTGRESMTLEALVFNIHRIDLVDESIQYMGQLTSVQEKE